MGLLSHSQQHGNHTASPKDLRLHIRKPVAFGSLQLPLNLLVPFLGEDFLLAFKGIDFSPDQPMGLAGGEPAIGFGAGVPFAALQFLGPMGFHFGRQRIIGKDGVVFAAHRIGDELVRLNFIRAEVIDDGQAPFAGFGINRRLALVPGFLELLQFDRLGGFFSFQTTGVSFSTTLRTGRCSADLPA